MERTKKPKNFGREMVFQRKPCMHDIEALKDLTKSRLEEESHCLPLEGLTKEKNLKREVVPAETP